MTTIGDILSAGRLIVTRPSGYMQQLTGSVLCSPFMNPFQVIFGDPAGALVIPALSALVTVGWKILIKPGPASPADWDVGLELLVAALIVNLIFLGSPEPSHIALRLLSLAGCGLALFVIAVTLKVAGHQEFRDDGGGEQRFEIKKWAALFSSAVAVVVLVAVFVLNINAASLAAVGW